MVRPRRPTPLSFARRSLYLKVRDRASFEFALASVAAALEIEEGKIRSARLALGGVATRPWRAVEAEAVWKALRQPEAVVKAASAARVIVTENE